MILLLLARGRPVQHLGRASRTPPPSIVVILLLISAEVWNEYRAKKAINALSKLAAPRARSDPRTGRLEVVDTSKVVPGDVLIIDSRHPGSRRLEGHPLLRHPGRRVHADRRVDARRERARRYPLRGHAGDLRRGQWRGSRSHRQAYADGRNIDRRPGDPGAEDAAAALHEVPGHEAHRSSRCSSAWPFRCWACCEGGTCSR